MKAEPSMKYVEGVDGAEAAQPPAEDTNEPETKRVDYRNFAEVRELRRQQTLQRSIPLQWAEQELHKRIAADGFYTDFFVYIPFLALFLVFFLNGRDITSNYYAAQGNKQIYQLQAYPNVAKVVELMQGLGGTQTPNVIDSRLFSDIGGADRFHSWVESVLIPGTWDCDAPGFSRSTLLNRAQMQYIGAMKIRALLATNTSCSINTKYTGASISELTNFSSSTGFNASDPQSTQAPTASERQAAGLPTECFAAFDSSKMQSRPRCNNANPALPSQVLWRYKQSWEDGGGLRTTGQLNLYPSGGYVVTLPFNATCNDIRALHDTIRSNSDCDIFNNRETRFVVVEWFQYASNTDTYLMNKYIFEVTPGGSWVQSFQSRMFPVWTLKRLGMSVFDIIFFLFVLYYVFRFFYDWLIYYRTHKKIAAFIFDLWNVLEAVNVVTLITVSALRWSWWTKSQSSKIDFPFEQAYPDDLDELVLVFSEMIYANSFNVVITILKVLKYFQLNNRLNILTRTLSAAQQGIVGVLALFLYVTTGYAVCASILYGPMLAQFRNVNTSFSTLSFMLLGQFDYDAMRAAEPVLTGFYFFSFMVLCMFMLLNFIIAILNEGFSTVSKDTALEPLDESILQQIYLLQEFFTFRNMKKIIDLGKRGKTRMGLLREVHKYLSEHLDLIATHTPALLDSDIPMSRDDLRHWLPEQLYSDLGDTYIDLLWEDMVREHIVVSSSDSYELAKDIEVAVLKGVAMVVKPERTILPLANMDFRVAAIEEQLNVVANQLKTRRPRQKAWVSSSLAF